MNASRLALTLCVGLAILAGCGGSQPPIGAAGAMPQTRAIVHHGTEGDLLYVVDSASGVYMYTYPAGEEVGLLKVNASGGLCSDKNGDVFVMDAQDSEVVEYAHGGSSPIATLNPDADPFYCSVDPKSGDLATLNSDYDDKASVSIFKNAAGKPTKYFDTGANLEATCSYDDKGNLYVGASTPSQAFAIAELRRGSGTFSTISLEESLRGGNFLQWDGKYVAVTNAAQSKQVRVLRVAISGYTGKVVSSTKLQGSVSYIKYFWIAGDTIATPRGGGGWKARKIGIWRYPVGGKALATTDLPKGTGIALGITVSRALR